MIEPMQAENDGRTWQRDDQGTITWWDGNQWVWWDPNVPGPRPPQHFFGSSAPAPPAAMPQRQGSSFGKGFGGALGCLAALAFVVVLGIVVLVVLAVIGSSS